MVQVVTNENMQQFIQTRAVPDFVPPKAEEPKVEVKTEEPKALANEEKQEQARGEDGQFVKREPESKAVESADADSDEDLPERVRRIVGKKHREKMEAEEFARERDRQAAVAEARAAEFERKLSELQKSGAAQEGKSEAKAEGEPQPEDFKTVAEYAKALVKWERALEKQEAARVEQENAQKQQQAAAESVKAQFVQRLEKTREAIPDYDSVVAAADTVIPPHMAQYVMESEMGPLLGYHLSKPEQKEVLQRLVKLSPVRAIAELGKLEASLEKKPDAKAEAVPVQVSKAPSPITPLKGDSTPVNKDPAKMTFQELRAYREAERAAGKR